MEYGSSPGPAVGDPDAHRAEAGVPGDHHQVGRWYVQ
jgi:hypothetical protein